MEQQEDKLVQELERRKEESAEQTGEKAADDEKKHHHHHHHHHHSGKKRRKKHRSSEKRKKRKKMILRILLIVGVLLVTAVIVVGATLFSMYRNGKNETIAENYDIKAPANVTVGRKGDYVYYNGSRYNLNKDIITMLFLGVDNKNSSEESKKIGDNHQADMIIVAAIDKVNQKISFINVPRDIITDVSVYSPGGGYVGQEKMQIALAYAYGDGAHSSCTNAREAVSRLFYNLPLSTYISLNMDGIEAINDSVGGVDVTSPETVGEFVKGEKYHLEGLAARHFVDRRSMERADANLLRNERQKLYMQAFLQKVIKATKNDLSVPVDLFNVAQDYVCTNINTDRITYLATEFVVNRSMQMNFLSVPVDVVANGGAAENYVKETEFYEQFLNVFYMKEK